MTEISPELVARCRTLGQQLGTAVVAFQMEPVNIDEGGNAPAPDTPGRNEAIFAKYYQMEAAAKVKWQAQFGAELDAVCDALAQSGTAPPIPPMDWDVQSMREISEILAVITA